MKFRRFPYINLLLLLCFNILFGYAQAQDTLIVSSDSFEVSIVDPQFLESEIEKHISEYDYKSAVGSILSAIDYFNLEKDLTKVNYYKLILSRVYLYLGFLQKSINTLEYCHVYFKQAKRDLDVIRSQHALAYAYKKAGNADMAFYFFGQCKDGQADKLNEFCRYEHQLIDAYLFLNQLKSPDNINEVFIYAKSVGNVELQVKALEILGEYYFYKANYKKAESVFKKALGIAKTFNYIDYCKQFNFRLYECSNNSGRYKNASDYLLSFVKYNDTILQISTSESLLKLIGKYEQRELHSEKIDLEKSKRLFELKSRRSNFTMYSLIFSIVAILFAGYFVILFYQQKLETNNIIHNQTEQINTQKIKQLENNIQLQSMQSLIDGQESERERIAQELHDSLGGLLSTIKIRFTKINHDRNFTEKDEYTKLYNLIDAACVEVRSISNDLKPGSLEKLGLLEAIKDLLNRYKLEEGPEIIFQYFGFNYPSTIDSNIALNIYRIIQELVNNAIKHAKCKEIFVQISKTINEMTITVEDDGIGFSTENVKKGMGLENIRSRVNYLRGEFNVESSENQGTLFLVLIPLH
jgi:signal transduction histidine kinase